MKPTALMMFAATATAHAQSLELIAMTDAEAPGLNGATYTALTLNATSGNGTIAISAHYSVQPGFGLALMVGQADTLAPRIIRGDPAPDAPDVFFDSFGFVTVTDDAEAAFSGSVTGAGVLFGSEFGYWVSSPTGTRPVARGMTPAPESGLLLQFPLSGGDAPMISGNGDTVATSALSDFSFGLYRFAAPPAQSEEVARSGRTIPAFPDATYSTIFQSDDPAINETGDLYFQASGFGLTGSVGAIFRAEPGQDPVPVIASGDPIPWSPPFTLDGSAFSRASNIAVNNHGTILTRIEPFGFGSTALILIDNNGAQRITEPSLPAPGIPGALMGSPTSNDYIIAGNGDFAYTWTLQQGTAGVDSTNDEAIWLSRDGIAEPVVREGSPAPGIKDATFAGGFASLANINLNDRGDFLFSARVVGIGINTTNDNALFFAPHDGPLELLLREGQPIELDGGTVSSTVAGFALRSNGSSNPTGGRGTGGQDGRARALDDEGRVLVFINLANGEDAIIRLSTDTAGCNPADLAEPLDLLDLADVTTFISAFTSNDPAADLDNSGLIDLADIVAFVTAFNAGCP